GAEAGHALLDAYGDVDASVPREHLAPDVRNTWAIALGFPPSPLSPATPSGIRNAVELPGRRGRARHESSSSWRRAYQPPPTFPVPATGVRSRGTALPDSSDPPCRSRAATDSHPCSMSADSKGEGGLKPGERGGTPEMAMGPKLFLSDGATGTGTRRLAPSTRRGARGARAGEVAGGADVRLGR